MRKVVERIEVMAINGDSKDALKYYENVHFSLYVIAVGGDKLSRGLTLEGLSVSYYFACLQNVRYSYADGTLVWVSPWLR